MQSLVKQYFWSTVQVWHLQPQYIVTDLLNYAYYVFEKRSSGKCGEDCLNVR